MIYYKKLRIFFSTLLLPLALLSCTQEDNEMPKLVINEILVNNQDNLQDDYGYKNGWIEIFNRTFSDQDLAGFRLKAAVNGGDTITYIIPNNDVQTAMPPRQHLLFWADGKPSRGTFHVSFKLDTLQENWIGLYNQGDKLIDQIVVPAGLLKADQSYARVADASTEWEVKHSDDAKKYVTPSTNNITQDTNDKIEGFQKNDKYGFVMAIIAMSVVFLTLLLLYICFHFIGKFFSNQKTKKNMVKLDQTPLKEEKKGQIPVSGEVYAAIAMAMHQATGIVHDDEDIALTITKVSKHWNELID